MISPYEKSGLKQNVILGGGLRSTLANLACKTSRILYNACYESICSILALLAAEFVQDKLKQPQKALVVSLFETVKSTRNVQCINVGLYDSTLSVLRQQKESSA